jgi:hypothetical protein
VSGCALLEDADGFVPPLPGARHTACSAASIRPGIQMAAGVEDWGAGSRRASDFGISQNPAYGLDLRQSRVQLNKHAGAVGAQAVILTKKTANVRTISCGQGPELTPNCQGDG